MNTYPTKDLIPGYLNNGTQSDKDFLEFHHWLYNISYIRCNINLLSYKDPERSIYFYKKYYDIDLSEEDLISKSYIGVSEGLHRYRIKNRKDVLKLINYDREILRRIASIYGDSIISMVDNILQGENPLLYMFHEDLFQYYQYHDYAESIYLSKYKVDTIISDSINDVYIEILETSLDNFPNHVTFMTIAGSVLKNVVIPKTITNLTLRDVNLNSVLFHDNITHLNCDKLPNIKLPSNLVYLLCRKLHYKMKLPDSLKALITSDRVDLSIIPKDIEYLSCGVIDFIDKGYVFDKCRYLCATYWKNMNSIFPNLEVLNFTAYSKDNNIMSLNKLIALLCHTIRFELPEGLVYIYEVENKHLIKIPNSVRVYRTDIINAKYNNLKTLYCDTIKQEYIPDELNILFTETMDLDTNDDVIYNFKEHNDEEEEEEME